MFKELDIVVLRHDIVDHGLKAGDIGTVVHCYKGAGALEVEFVTAQGSSVAVLTLSLADVRPFAGREILHVRGLEQAAAC